jgi:hypothetical protein
MIILAKLCHFLMREYMSPHGAYHTSDGHMAQFPYNKDKQNSWKLIENLRKFVDVYRCINLYMGNFVYRTCMVFDD